MTHEPKKVPDPSPSCPRCHYFERQELAAGQPERTLEPRYPHGINQQVAGDILAKAFPQKQRSY